MIGLEKEKERRAVVVAMKINLNVSPMEKHQMQMLIWQVACDKGGVVTLLVVLI